MPYDFRTYNVIYIVYGRTNKNRWSLFITRYSLLRIQIPEIIFYSFFKQFKFYTLAQNQDGAFRHIILIIEPRFRILATYPFFLGTGKVTVFLE